MTRLAPASCLRAFVVKKAKMNLRTLPFFTHVNWDPDRAERRKFAQAMLVGFFLIGLLVAWRRHELSTATGVLWMIGVILAAGSQVPEVGKLFYLAVYLPTSVIGFFISRIILTIIFYLVFAPMGLLLKLTGKDLLSLKRRAGVSAWTTHPGVRARKSYYRQL